MLSLRPLPAEQPVPADTLSRRGRSRQISRAALARQASEERRINEKDALHRLFLNTHIHATPSPRHSHPIQPAPVDMKPPSCTPSSSVVRSDQTRSPILRVTSPDEVATSTLLIPSSSVNTSASPSPPTSSTLSPDYLDSPPSPLRSLEDQVHVAYALDDIHLAKVLLLKLKGIEVESDDDPRIAQVQDQDFDFCLMPHGKLMSDADELALKERQRQELEKLEERRREERLKMCERRWDEEKRRVQQEKAMAARKKEAEERRKAEKRNNSEAPSESDFPSRLQRTTSRSSMLSLNLRASSRAVVSYELLPRPAPSDQDDDNRFVYNFMVTPRSTPPSQSSIKSRIRISLANDSQPPGFTRTVPFKDVLNSMRGSLFPLQAHEQNIRRFRSRRHPDLVDSLFDVVVWEENERRLRKGKWKEQPIWRRRSDKSSLCAACSVASPRASSFVSSSSSSSASWLSSSPLSWLSSPSTAPTTPSSSTRSSWFTKTTDPVPSAPSPPCRCQPRLVSVPLAESPLAFSVPDSSSRNNQSNPQLSRSLPDSETRQLASVASESSITRHVMQLLRLAKEFQSSYINATVFSMSTFDSYEDYVSGRPSSDKHGRGVQPSRRIRPHGYRARASDVSIFIDSCNSSPQSQPLSPLSPPIPLRPRYPPDQLPHTILPDPLPYPVVFKPIPKPCRSPFRHYVHTGLPAHARTFSNAYSYVSGSDSDEAHAPWAIHTYSGMNAPYPVPADVRCAEIWHATAVICRRRTIENPVYLRLKALHKLMWDRGMNWQGRARDDSLGAGGEKLTRFAFEGIGRSRLGLSDAALEHVRKEMMAWQRSGGW